MKNLQVGATFRPSTQLAQRWGHDLAPPTIDNSRAILVLKYYELDKCWGTSKTSNRVDENICDFGLILEATPSTPCHPVHVFEHEISGKSWPSC